MFADLDRAVREMGATDLGVGRHVKAMARGFYGRIAAYEQGLAVGDRALEDALRRNLFGTAPASDATLAAAAAYVRRQAASLASAPARTLLEGAVPWRRVTPEFSRPVEAPRTTGRPATHKIAANADERAALAQRFGLLSLDRLEAEVRLERLAGGLVRLSSTLSADAVQACVVTLEPVPARIAEEFSMLYGEGEDLRDVTLDGEEEPVEPLEGGRIDIGEAVAQQLSLALDPFPRAPDL